MNKDLVPIGKVTKPHGIRGKIKVEYYGGLQSLSSLSHVYIEDRSEGRKPRNLAAISPPRIILQLKGIEKIEEARPLVGKEILVKKEAFPDLPEGEYYWIEILGMEVETEEGSRIGKVKEIFSTGANDVYVVEGKRGEFLLPATEGVIRSVDREKE
jgi:16S rRNA processing protein RimM